MSAPVHRFAAVDCPQRRPRTVHRNHPPAPIPAVANNRRQPDNSIYVEIPPEPPPTIASLAAARSVTPDTLLRTAALGLVHHRPPMMTPHLKFGIMVSFALATLFLAAAKYYFEQQVARDNSSSGSEATIVCAAVAFVFCVGCALSMCRASPPPPLPPERISSTARREVQSIEPPQNQQQTDHRAHSSESSEVSLTTLVERALWMRESSPPPPYQIAVLMPGRDRESPPPPAYDELS